MLTKRLLSRSILGAALLGLFAALPAAAHDRDDYRRDDRADRNHHDNRDWGRWHHGDNRHFYPREPRIYERHYIQPQAYYAPAYGYVQPREGVTITFRNHW